MRNWDRNIFALAVVGLIFLAGILIGHYEYWPFETLHRAAAAARALRDAYFPAEGLNSAHVAPCRRRSPLGAGRHQ